MKNYLGCQNCVKTERKMLTAYGITPSGCPQAARSPIYYV